jgi:hypothetical protein
MDPADYAGGTMTPYTNAGTMLPAAVTSYSALVGNLSKVSDTIHGHCNTWLSTGNPTNRCSSDMHSHLVIRFVATGFLIPSLLPACATPSPHENFKSILGADVGKSADDPTSSVARYPQLLIGRRILSNGAIENEYRWRGACHYFFEINPKTNIIVRWRYQGNDGDCAIVP